MMSERQKLWKRAGDEEDAGEAQVKSYLFLGGVTLRLTSGPKERLVVYASGDVDLRVEMRGRCLVAALFLR